VTARDASTPVAMHQARNVTEAGMIRGALEDAGIPCHVDNEMYTAMEVGGYPACGALALRVVVPARCVERAREILAAMGLRQDDAQAGRRGKRAPSVISATMGPCPPPTSRN